MNSMIASHFLCFIEASSKNKWWIMIDWWGTLSETESWKSVQLSIINYVRRKYLQRINISCKLKSNLPQTETSIILVSSTLYQLFYQHHEGGRKTSHKREKIKLINLIWWFTDVAFQIITIRVDVQSGYSHTSKTQSIRKNELLIVNQNMFRSFYQID